VASIVNAKDASEELPGLRQAQHESFTVMDEFTKA
jgi:hypothetical protein